MNKNVTWSIPLLTTLLVSVILCLLMPLSMYDSNPSEFPMLAYSELLVYSGSLAILVATILFLLLLSVRRWLPKLLLPSIGLILGLSVALYVQGNLIGADYGALDGHVIRWDLMRTTAIVNTLVWIVCISIPVLVAIFARRAAEKCFGLIVPIFLAYVSLLYLMLFFANISAFNRKKPAGFNYDKFMELSSERNLVIIILDSFDRAIFDCLLREDPAWRKRFRGFTYYHNTVGAFCYTCMALPQIVSGYAQHENDPTVWEYQRKAYQEAPFLKAARNCGFLVDAYYDETACPLAVELDGFGWFGNAVNTPPEFVSLENLGHYSSLYFCSIFRYLPHFLKKWWFEHQNDFKESVLWDIDMLTSSKVEVELNKRLNKRPFSLVHDKKVKLYHCSSIHVPSFRPGRARENLEMVCSFLDKTREAGVYDKTDFFIMADHGSINRCRPLFMCSNRTEEFCVSEMPFSYRHLCEAFTDSLNGRPIQPIESSAVEMVPMVDDPRRVEMDIVVDEKFFDGIGTEFSGNALELLATSAEMDVVTSNGVAKLTWNGKSAMIGLPVEKEIQGGKLSVSLTFDGNISERLSFSVQYSDNKTHEVRCAMFPGDGHTDLIIQMPDMPKNVDRRYAKLILHERKGQEPLSIISVKIRRSECNE